MTRSFDVYRWQLQSAIRRSGRTRAELARRLGLKPATLKAWVSGRRSPTVRRLLDLLQLLEVEPARLFQQPDDMPTPHLCSACGRSFSQERFYRIHVALQAKTCPEHDKLVDPTRSVG